MVEPEPAGQTVESAVRIATAPNIPAEYNYLRQAYGVQDVDWTLQCQMLFTRDGRTYDLIEIALANGEERQTYFDITDWAGDEAIRAGADAWRQTMRQNSSKPPEV